MTTLNEARQIVYRRFMALWKDGAEELSPFCFDNERLDPVPAVWARCSVRSMPGGQATLGDPGNRKYHRKGLARVEVYAEPGSGRDRADTMCRAAQNMFEGHSLDGLMFFDTETAEQGLVDDDRWDLSTVEAFFDYEEIK